MALISCLISPEILQRSVIQRSIHPKLVTELVFSMPYRHAWWDWDEIQLHLLHMLHITLTPERKNQELNPDELVASQRCFHLSIMSTVWQHGMLPFTTGEKSFVGTHQKTLVSPKASLCKIMEFYKNDKDEWRFEGVAYLQKKIQEDITPTFRKPIHCLYSETKAVNHKIDRLEWHLHTALKECIGPPWKL